MSPSRTDTESSWRTFFFRDTRALILLMGMVSVAGLTSISVLPRMEDPVLARRIGLIATRVQGANASRVEALVTEPIEDLLQDVEEIKKITSESRPEMSSISIELRDEIVETDEVWSEVRGKVNDAVAVLPPDAARPQFEELDVRAYAMIVSVAWDRQDSPNWTLLRRYAKQLEDTLQAVPGSETIDRFADPGEEITVMINPERAASLGLSATDVAAQLGGSDARQSAGLFRTQDQQITIEMANQFGYSASLEETLIRSFSDGKSVRLGDIATVHRGVPNPLPRYAVVDGRPAVTLGVMVRKQSRIDKWRLGIESSMNQFKDQLPSGLALDVSLDQNRYVSNRLSSLIGNLFLGVSAVVVVIWFLMGFRSAIIVAMALPLSGLTVLFGLRAFEIPIHQMSITGMIIAIGLLIDNAIVAVDEISAELKKGVAPRGAIDQVIAHLTIPLIGSTITTALAFAPIAMMPGPAGEFVGSISVSVILAVFASLFFSLTVIPVLAARFLGPGIEKHQDNDQRGMIRRWIDDGFSSKWIARAYDRLLHFALSKPSRGIAISMALPMVGFWMFGRLPEQFFPAADRDQFYVEVELPANARISATEAATQQVNELLMGRGAKKISWFLGESPPVFYYNIVGSKRGVANFASAIVQMESSEGILEKINQLQIQADRLVPNARVLMRQLEQGPPFTAPIEVRLFGPDLERLRSLGAQVRLALSRGSEITHTKSLLGETLPKVTLKVNETASRLVGLQPKQISRQLFDQLEGRLAGQIIEDTETIPVMVRIDDERREKFSGLESLELIAGENRVPLSSIATASLNPEIAVITRLGRRRMNEVSGYIEAGKLPSESLAQFEAELTRMGFELPSGYSMEYGGEASQRNQAVGNLMANVGLLVVAMIAVLVLSFRSFRFAAMILVVAVLSMGLGMIGLYFGGFPFGFMAIIGTMGLIGVAINDSIVVLAALRQDEELNAPAGQAEFDQRLVAVTARCTRHVLATTLTTIAGFSPLIIAGGKFWPPLAISIAGGVTGATLIALFFVPAGYRLLTKPHGFQAASNGSLGTGR